jgi:SAM-dependent methyltransferase
MSHVTSSGQSWDDRYSGEEYAFGVEPNDFLVHAVEGMGPGRMLVLGDGEGRNGVFLASKGHQVVTVDLSPVGVDKAMALAARSGVILDARVADLADFDMGEAEWDTIVSIFCHLPSDLRKIVHESVKRALRPGGTFVLEAYNSANIGRGVGGPQDSDMTVEPEELEAQFAGWNQTALRKVDRQIDEGRYHSGMSATTQFVAVKPSDHR